MEIKIKNLAKKYNIIAKKSLGQNFIFDLNLTDKIVKFADITTNDNIIEIGSGAGSLTFSILKQNPKSLTIIEKDSRCIKLLAELKEYFLGKINTEIIVINEDFLEIDLKKRFSDRKYKIISNLPYNIATKILFNLLDNYQNISLMILMFQKEVVDRIVAKENSKKYGRISVMVNFICYTKFLLNIKPENFSPQPKITSALIQIIPREKPLFNVNLNLLKVLVKTSFSQRRKMIKSCLRSLDKNAECWIKKANINPNLRAENMTLEDFANLTKVYPATLRFLI